jgi:hypothetical protein
MSTVIEFAINLFGFLPMYPFESDKKKKTTERQTLNLTFLAHP